MIHPDTETLELYVAGGLPNGRLADLEAHFTDCDDCLAEVMEQARLEMVLTEVGCVAEFCPGCGRVATDNRCKHCGAARNAGGFRIAKVLVESGKGRMYLAFDDEGRRVALKELIFVHAPSMRAIEEFEREAKFLKALHHPNIPDFVASFSEGTGVDTRLYLAQEYIEGRSLQDKLAVHFFTEREITDIAVRVLQTLVYLQALSPMVIHRDIKPANLIMRDDGTIAIVDFGAALVDSRTAATTGVGTYGYMPVEQLAGIVDETTDVYALGASLLHLATRCEPWKVLDDLGGQKINVSKSLLRLLHKMVSRSRQDRFANAGDALRAIERQLRVPERRIPAVAAMLAAAVVVGGGAVAAVAMLGDDDVASTSEQPAAAVPRVEPPVVTAEPPAPPTPVPARPKLESPVEIGIESCDRVIAMYTSCDKLPQQARDSFINSARVWSRTVESGNERARAMLSESCEQVARSAPPTLRALGCGDTDTPEPLPEHVGVDDLRKLYRQNGFGLQRCMQRHAAKGGKYQLRISVAPSGRVNSVDIDSDNERFRRCVVSAVRRWRFRQSRAGGDIVEPLVFKVSSGRPERNVSTERGPVF